MPMACAPCPGNTNARLILVPHFAPWAFLSLNLSEPILQSAPLLTGISGGISGWGMTQMSPILRRVIYAVLFEAIGLIISTLGLLAFSDQDAKTAGGAALGSMIIALLFNYVFNAGFEAWERRQTVKGRSLRRRIVHGALFEGGLLILMVPFLAWWMGVTLLQALIYDAGLLVFFAVYTFGFTWVFDRVFGLPASAR
jgi:uncharacterized membrane protein